MSDGTPFDMPGGAPRSSTEGGSAHSSGDEATATYARPPRGADARPLQRGESLGRFVVLESLGQGGMGRVYSAYDPQLDRRVALKLLRLNEAPGARRRTTERRLLREAQALARLTDPNVVTVHDAGTLEGRVFVVMEQVPGVDLGTWLGEERSVPDILGVFRQAGRGLAAAHRQGLVHRDFKPRNVMVRDDGRVQVLDFGLAQASYDPSSEGGILDPETLAAGPRVDGEPSLTLPGAVLGTPGYMAPEQLAGEATGPTTDQWAFCVALFRALYGRHPLGLSPRPDHRDDWNVELPEEPRLSPRMRRALLRGLAFRPEDRHPSMVALLAELRPSEGRRRRWLAAGVVALAASVAFVALRPEPPCPDATPRLAGVWDGDRRGELEAAFLGTGKPYATGVVASVSRLFDGYARSWVAMHGETCRATHVRGEQSEELLDRRMACLDQRREALGATVDLLTDDTDAVIERAVRVVSGLEPLATCADTRALLAAVPPPDPEVTDSVESLRTQLATARGLQLAGQADVASVLAGELVEPAESLGYWPLVAEVRRRQAGIEEQQGAPEASETLYRQTLLAAQAGGHERIAAEAMTRLVRVVGYLQADLDGGEAWATMAESAIGRLRQADDLSALLADHRGVLALRAGDLDTAAAQHRQAIDGYRALGDPHQGDLGRSLVRLANVELSAERPTAARPHLEEALSLYQGLFGEGHPETAEVHERLALMELQTNNPLAARGHLEVALETLQGAYGADHPSVASARVHLGQSHAQLGEHTRAQEHFEGAAAIYRQAYGDQHPHVSFALSSLGSSLAETGELDRARTLLLEVLEAQRVSHGDDHPWLAATHHNLGDLASRQGDFGEAETRHRRALELWEPVHGPKHRLIALGLIGLGRAEGGLGRSTAVATLERALAIAEPAGLAAEELGEARFELAQVLSQTTNDRERALELAQEALEAYRQAGEAHQESLARVETWLAEQAEP